MEKIVKIQTINDCAEMTITRNDKIIMFTVNRGSSKRSHNESRGKNFTLTTEQLKKVINHDTKSEFNFGNVCIIFLKEINESPTVWIIFYDLRDSRNEKEIIIIDAEKFLDGCENLLRGDK